MEHIVQIMIMFEDFGGLVDVRQTQTFKRSLERPFYVLLQKYLTST